ncbi:MAG: helix-turn-helix domain-containing protein [Janthinobacterium lividum]
MKTNQHPTSPTPAIVFSHYESRQVSAEQCVATHGLTCILAGSLRVTDAGASQTFGVGSLLFPRKNFLAKFIKQPALNEPFRAITVAFDPALLLEYSQQHGVGGQQPYVASSAVTALAASPLLYSFFDTLRPYFEEPLPAPLAKRKQLEALRLLLQVCPALQPVLFDFGQPGKIDLEAFMRQHFRFNIGLKQLAYLTGRSLATFKRDFKKVFHTSPTRWLYQKRLAEAHYLLQEQRMRPSDVYHEVGFESLAHFSHAFKQFFGCNPSSICAATAAR